MKMKKKLDSIFQGFSSEDVNLIENIILATSYDECDKLVDYSKLRPIVNREILNKKPEFTEDKLYWQTIRTLGIINKKNDPKQQGKFYSEEYLKISTMLASLNRSFGISCSCNSSGVVDFNIGIRGDYNGSLANSMLRASFGTVDIEEAENISDSKCDYSFYGQIQPIKRDLSNLEKIDNEVSISKWIDEVAAAVIGTNCYCKILFQPISRNVWTNSYIDELCEYNDEISNYLKHQAQVSASKAVSDSFVENASKLFSIKKKGNSETASSSITMNISNQYPVNDIELESMESNLKYQIRLMEQIEKFGWAVKIIVGAPDKDDSDAAVICVAIDSAFLSLGYKCTWKAQLADNTPSVASGVFPSYFLPSIISFPTESFVGLNIEKRSCLELNIPLSNNNDQDDIVIGNILWNRADSGQKMCIPRKEMNRHTIVFGMTGSGKSTTVRSMLNSLDDLNYLVIEPVKGEYHVLPGIERYTMLLGEGNGLKMNPFWFYEGASLQYHIDSLKLIISSAFDLYAAMPNILEQCLYKVYSNCGWNIISGKNMYKEILPEEDLYPTFEDLCIEIEKYLDESAFEGETSGNYRGALLSRLQSFTSGAKGLFLNTTSHIDFEDWVSKNIVVELDALADDSDKAIVMGALLVQYFQYIKYSPAKDSKKVLKHLLVLEEAHHLFKETQAKENGANATGQLVSMLNNLLAEIRAYGEGFVIIDQSPSSISSSVIKNTAVKIVHRVDYGEDIKLLQSALLLEEGDNTTASLAPGEALVRYGTMRAPAYVGVDYNDVPSADISKTKQDYISDEGIIDSVISNSYLMNNLKQEISSLINLLLFCSEQEKIVEGIEEFRYRAGIQISHYCGMDLYSDSEYKVYIKLLDICTVHDTLNKFAGQYSLQRIIRMYILRLANFVLNKDNKGLTSNLWSLFSDYRRINIHQRMSNYYLNHSNHEYLKIVEIYGGLAQTGLLRDIIKELWDVPKDDKVQLDEYFDKAMDRLFYVRPPEYEIVLLKDLTVEFFEELKE